MNKEKKNLELKIYELLGIKLFKKIVFGLRDQIYTLFFLWIPKEERKKILYHTPSFYNLGKVNSINDIKKFKKKLFINAGFHIFSLSQFISIFSNIVAGNAALSTIIINLTCITINLYCIMLQRYNCVRINQLIEKMKPHYEKQKDKIKEELKKEDSLLNEHTYKIVKKKDKEKIITFEELISNVSIQELKQYRKYLEHFKQINQGVHENNNCPNEQTANIVVPIKGHKQLKLEFKAN